MTNLTRRYPEIVQAPERSSYPLSYQQERVYYLDQLTTEGALWNLVSVKRLKGILHIDAMRQAVGQLIDRHPALRTIISVENRQLMQTIRKTVPDVLQIADASAGNRKTRERQAQDIISQQCLIPISIKKQEPLFQVTLVILGEEEFLLSLRVHHIIADAATFQILWKDLKCFYNQTVDQKCGAKQPGVDYHKMPPRITFGDYALWQKEVFAEDRTREQEEYWLNQFQEKLPVLDLLTDFPQQAQISFNGSLEKMVLPATLVRNLKMQSMENRVMLFSLMLAAYFILLHKLCRQEDIVVGTVFSGRHYHQELASMAGFFVNTVAIRMNIDEDITWSEMLQLVHKSVDEAYCMQDYPFERLVKRLNPERHHTRNPLFRAMFNMVTETANEGMFSGLSEAWEEAVSNATQTDLLFDVRHQSEATVVWVEYNTDLFRKDTIQHLLRLYMNLLEDIAGNPHARVNELRLTSAADRNLIIEQFNHTRVEYPSNKSIYELFQEQVKKSPDRVAICGEKVTLSYAELSYKASRLSALLQSKGVKQGDVVGLIADRSVELIVGMLAIIQSGGAYLPMDAAYSAERIQWMLRDCSAQTVLVQENAMTEGLQGVFQESGTVFIEIGSLDILEQVDNEVAHHCAVLPEALAYIMYTSGSTGTPKGVMIGHRNVVRLVMNPLYANLEPGSRILLTGSPSFDAATFEIWGALLNGMRLYLADEEILLRHELLGKYIAKHQINILWLTAPLFRRLAEQEPSIFAALDTLLVGGDIVCPRQAARVKAACPGVSMLNMYGPTENTTFSTFYPISEDNEDSIPIGRPIGNSTAYVVDSCGNLLPTGVAGELCVGGDGLALGYVNRPDLTSEKFIAFPQISQERLYRTGDLALWLPDGNLQFLGRMDQQVKIRGYRVEPGEVEGVLLTVPGVKAAAVLARDDPSGDKMLYAYLVCSDEFRSEEAGNHLDRRLPRYMHPSKLIRVENIPLTRNGKIDIAALPKEDTEKKHLTQTAPNTDIAGRLAEIWKHVLHVEHIWLEDSFFVRGGHSLKAAELLSCVYEEFGVQLSLKEIIEHAVLKDMAHAVEQACSMKHCSIDQVSKQQFYPVSSSQKRMYLVHHMSKSKGIVYNMPIVMSIEGAVNRHALEKVFQQLIDRHESLRTSFEMREGHPVQVIWDKVDFQLKYVEKIAPHEAEPFIQSFIKPFELGSPPLLRAALLHVEPNHHLLIIDQHHIVSDGVSLNILFQEIGKLYHGEQLTPLSLQYKDFAAWQNNRLEQGNSELEAYWLGILEGELPVLHLLTDYPRRAARTFEGDRIHFKVDSKQTMLIRQMAANNGVTVYMLLLASFHLFLAKYSGQEDILVGTPISGRYIPEAQKIMGMFVNTLVIRSKPVGHISFKQFLQQIKSTAIHAYEHQEYPFDRLVEKAGANRDTSRNPVFDVMFNMQQSELNRLELGQWRLSEHSFQYNIAKFDLTLTATEQDGELCFEMEYAADLFKRETVERMSRHYLHVLEQGIHDADKFIAEIELVTETEKHQILLDFNDTLRAYPADKCIHELFDEQAIALMDKIALSSQGYHWTYGELNRISDLLAKWLRKKGIRPEQTVGVVAERSCALVISILAILKAGGVYLPIDPSYPVDRVRYMLDDCEVKLLLVQQKMKSSALIAELLELRGETELVLVGERPLEDWYVEESVDLDESNLIQDSRPESLAYIMYTSGTTGQPKGVMVEHRNVVRLVKNCHYAPLYEGTRILLTGSPSFDAATFEIWGALLNGMQLFIADDDVLMRDDYLAGFLQEHDINLLWLTAPLFRQLADRKPDLFQPLHTLLVGGDVLPIHQVKQVREACPDLIIQNMYGPTENTTFSTYHVVNDSLEAGIPIGKPITNSTAYIMDRYRRLLPIGVVGEICVGGDGLARGYVHRDDLTDSRFVHNPYAPGERMYLTGDLGRWLPDGSIEFLGRRDNQVKIRGYRIEIEEIEQQLRACPDIREAVVTVGENSSGEKQLIAYVVTNESETKPRTEEWRDRLAKALPAYMIPALFCTVDFIPLKANGKMDLSALPSPDHIVSESAYSKDDGASTDIEKKMVELIKRLLSVEHVRMSDQLLLLGGHSLIFINLAIEIEQLFGVSLSIVDVMESRTISDLTAKVVQLHEGDVLQNI